MASTEGIGKFKGHALILHTEIHYIIPHVDVVADEAYRIHIHSLASKRKKKAPGDRVHLKNFSKNRRCDFESARVNISDTKFAYAIGPL